MQRVIPSFLMLIMSISCTQAQGELITYKLIDGAAGDQAGHSLSGTITLDPSCASTCTSLHSWEYTISGPILNRTVSSDDIGEFMQNPNGLFVATPTHLTVKFSELASDEGLILDLNGLAWNTFYIDIDPDFGRPEYFAYDGNLGGWDTEPSGTVTIATAVPEPSAFCFLGLLGIGSLICRRRKRT